MNNRNVLNSLIKLAIPTILQEIMGTLLTYVDTAMVGHLGEKATASVSTTTTVIWLVSSLPYAFAIGFMAMVSRAYGAKDEKRINALSHLAVFMALGFGVVITVICVGLSPFIPIWMRAAEDIRRPASVYFCIVSMAAIFRISSTFFGTCIQAVKDTKTPMIINLSSNLLNVILNGILIYGLGMGVTGAAVATALSYTVQGLVMSYAFTHKKELGGIRFREIFAVRKDLLAQVSKIALPAMGTHFISCAGYVAFAAMVSGMGTTIFAAHSIAVNAEEIFYLPGYGLRTATSALVGISIGEKDWEKLRAVRKQSVFITIGMMCFNGILLYLAAYPLMKLFTSSAEVASLGSEMLKIVAFSEPFFGLMIAWEGICYGFGRTKSVFIIESFSMWAVRILSTFIVVEILHLGLREVWYCMIADNVFKALALTVVNVFSPPEKLIQAEKVRA